jgi:quinol monooxygenase YgiN
MILIVVKFPVLPDRVDEWVSVAEAYTDACRAEEGNVFFEWSRSLADPDTFVLVEGFRDGEAGAGHVATDHFRKFVATAPDLVAAQPQIMYVDSPELSGWGPMGEITPRNASR